VGSPGDFFYAVGGGESATIAPDPRDPDLFYAGATNTLDRFDRRTGQARDVQPNPYLVMGEAAEVMPEATPESQARGREVLQAAISGLGGLEALESVSNLSVLSEMTQLTPQGEMTLNTKSVLQLPDKARTDIVTPFGAFTMVYDAGTGWMKTPQGVQDLPPAQMQELRKAVSRHPIVLLVEALKAERPVQFLESTTVEGREVDAILVPDASGESVKLYVDKETGRILKRSFRALSPQGAVEQDQIFSDFRPVGALAMAFKEVTYQNGEKMGERTVKNVEVNVALDPAVFAREETKPE